MNVLMINSFLHPRGGDTTCMFTAARALRAAGHTVAFFAMRHPDNLPAEEEPHFPPWNAPERPRPATLAAALWSRDAAARIGRLLERRRFDVAHAHHLHRHLSPSVLAELRRRGVPAVWTLHDYELICPSGLLYAERALCTRCVGGDTSHAIRLRCKKDSLVKSAFVAAEKALHRWIGAADLADRLICPSRFLMERVREAGVAADRLLHLPNPVDPPEIGDPVAEPGEPPGLVLAGRLTAEKGVEEAVEAARRLPGAILHVCGEGPERARLERRLPDRVRWHGHLPVSEVGRRIGAARAVLVPSRWPENQPYAVLEAQARGVPVIASRVGGIPELIEDGRTGLLVPPGDPAALAAAADRLLRDPAGAAALGARARRGVAAIHDPAQHAKRLVEIYGTLPA